MHTWQERNFGNSEVAFYLTKNQKNLKIKQILFSQTKSLFVWMEMDRREKKMKLNFFSFSLLVSMEMDRKQEKRIKIKGIEWK